MRSVGFHRGPVTPVKEGPEPNPSGSAESNSAQENWIHQTTDRWNSWWDRRIKDFSNAWKNGGLPFIDGDLASYPKNESEFAKERQRIDQALRDRLGGIGPASDQQEMLDDIKKLNISDHPTVDFWHGAHVVVKDDGSLYEKWSKMPSVDKRISTHCPGVKAQQYELDFPKIGAVLFGVDKGGNTWFQAENNQGAGNFADAVGHVADFLIHKGCGDQNVGPMGLSPYSDKLGTQLIVAADGSGLISRGTSSLSSFLRTFRR